jgi:hypothetical protein
MKPVSQMTNAELAVELSETATTMHPVMQTEKTLLREAASRLQAPAVAEDGWQPIETAPKDRKVLAGYFNEMGKWRTITACYHTRLEWSDEQDPPEDAGEYAPEGWYEESESADTIYRAALEPTRWMPLPAAPGGSE